MNRKLIAALLVLSLAFSVGFAYAKGCETTTYSNVQPKVFDCMKTKLQNYGISVPQGYKGELSGKGIAASFVYDADAKSLTIQIKDKPLFVSCDIAANEIKKFVDECQLSSGKA
jgi:hypothetical protein